MRIFNINILTDKQLLEKQTNFQIEKLKVNKYIGEKRQMNNHLFDMKVLWAYELLKASNKNPSIRSISKLISKENSIRSVWLSIQRLKKTNNIIK